jgi:hypothetical protein
MVSVARGTRYHARTRDQPHQIRARHPRRSSTAHRDRARCCPPRTDAWPRFVRDLIPSTGTNQLLVVAKRMPTVRVSLWPAACRQLSPVAADLVFMLSLHPASLLLEECDGAPQRRRDSIWASPSSPIRSSACRRPDLESDRPPLPAAGADAPSRRTRDARAHAILSTGHSISHGEDLSHPTSHFDSKCLLTPLPR